MNSLLATIAPAGAMGLAGTAVELWAGGSLAVAQSRISACFQNCTNVRRWPASQCRELCMRKSRRM